MSASIGRRVEAPIAVQPVVSVRAQELFAIPEAVKLAGAAVVVGGVAILVIALDVGVSIRALGGRQDLILGSGGRPDAIRSVRSNLTASYFVAISQHCTAASRRFLL